MAPGAAVVPGESAAGELPTTAPAPGGPLAADVASAGPQAGGFSPGGPSAAGFSPAGPQAAGLSPAGSSGAGFSQAGPSGAGLPQAGPLGAGFSPGGSQVGGFSSAGSSAAGLPPAGSPEAGSSPGGSRTDEPRPGELPTVAPSPAAPSPAAPSPAVSSQAAPSPVASSPVASSSAVSSQAASSPVAPSPTASSSAVSSPAASSSAVSSQAAPSPAASSPVASSSAVSSQAASSPVAPSPTASSSAVSSQAAPSPAAPSLAAPEPPPGSGLGAFQAAPDSITPAGSYTPAPRTPARRRRRMPLLAGVAGVLAVALTVYLVGSLNTKGTVGTEPSAGPTATRWAALPKGWRAWQTTLFAAAEAGVREAPERGSSRGPDPQPSCVEGGGAVYCVGVGVLPAKVDATTGRTLWRARSLPEGTSVDRYGAKALGVRDDALLLVETITNAAANDTSSRVTAYAVTDGRRLWTRPVDERYVDAVLLGETVLMGDGTATTARSPRDGTKLWTATPLAGYRCDYREAGDALYADCVNYHTASGADRVLFAVSATDGTTRRLNSAPPVHAAYAGDLDGSLLYAAQEGEDDGAYTKTVLIDPTADTARTTPLSEPLQGWPVLVHGVLCAAESSGRVTAVSPRTGARLWQTATTLEQPSAPVADTLRSLFVTTASGRIAALDAQTGTALWESYPRAARVSGTVTTIPTLLLHRGALVVPTPDGSLFSIDPANPGK
ncbi:PQQ-binding-like beta-propeller repeat protein [Streptomyces roseirectus]|uniref:outer membrane protein assembly factor BamB family protein n=1 Tax=Streptomyces roseirectus TaxID=2768066 RepID=UPI0031B589B0